MSCGYFEAPIEVGSKSGAGEGMVCWCSTYNARREKSNYKELRWMQTAYETIWCMAVFQPGMNILRAEIVQCNHIVVKIYSRNTSTKFTVYLNLSRCSVKSFGEAGVAVKHAIDVGYRHFDTAFLYGNEVEVGEAIREKIAEGVVKREDIFIVTKVYTISRLKWKMVTHFNMFQLWNTHHEPDKVEAACRKSSDNLGLGYIDLYLMHYPNGFVERQPFEFWPKLADGTHEHT